MTLDEVMELLAGVEMDEEQRGIISQSITDLHDGVTAGAQAKIAQLETAVSEAQKANEALKAQNYDLLVSATAPVDPEPTPEDEEAEAKKAVDDLFKEC